MARKRFQARIATIKQGKIKKRATARAMQGPKVDRRHHMGVDEWAASGKRVLVKSSWVKSIQYDYKTKDLTVEYKNKKKGMISYVTCKYPGVDVRTAKNMYLSASQGKYVWAKLYTRPYSMI